jgi:hypothetical protein
MKRYYNIQSSSSYATKKIVFVSISKCMPFAKKGLHLFLNMIMCEAYTEHGAKTEDKNKLKMRKQGMKRQKTHKNIKINRQ